MAYIPYGRHDINDDDIAAVVRVLKSDFLTQGPAVPQFEQGIADYSGAKYAVAVNSATSALHLAYLSIGVTAGDLVWVPPITFVATANAARYCGADIDFVDVDAETSNMSVEALASKLSEAEAHGRLPKLIVVVHMCGTPCDMERISQLARAYGVAIVEDASHAIGSRYQGKLTGSCEYSDIAVFSFHPVKIMTTAEGGLATTNSLELAEKMRLLRSHGISRDATLMESEAHGDWYYEQIELGYNYRMTELQAALGCSQLERLDEFVEKRHQLVDRYFELLQDVPVQLPPRDPDMYSSYHLFVIGLDENQLGDCRGRIFHELRAAGIGVNVHYMPVYLQPYYRRLGFESGYCPAAETYYKQAISIPLFPGLSESDQDFITATLKKKLS